MEEEQAQERGRTGDKKKERPQSDSQPPPTEKKARIGEVTNMEGLREDVPPVSAPTIVETALVTGAEHEGGLEHCKGGIGK